MDIDDGLAHYDGTLSLVDIDLRIGDLSCDLTQAPDNAVVLNNLGAWRQARFERSGDAADIEAAIDFARAALHRTPSQNRSDRIVRELNLGTALLSGMDRSGGPDRLQEAVSLLRDIRPGSQTDPTAVSADVVALVWANLCDGLLLQSVQDGRTHALTEAVAAGRRAVDSAPPGSVVRPVALVNYGNALRAYADHTAQWSCLDEAVHCLREASDSAAPTNFHRLGHLADLATTLLSRFDLRAELQDLDEAIAALRTALADTAPGDPRRPGRLANLASAFQRRYQHLGAVAELKVACEYDHAAVEATDPQDRRWPGRLSNLAIRLMLLFHAEGNRDRTVIDKAVACFGQALQRLPDSSALRWRVQTNLGNTLRTRSYYFDKPTDLTEAFRLGSEAVAALPVEHPQAATCAYNLALTLRAVYALTKDPQHLEAAVRLAAVAALRTSAPASTRMTAAIDWAEWASREAADLPPPVGAADGYAAAVTLLPLVAWLGLGRESKEQALANWSTLPMLAAAHATESGLAELAVQFLELGRSVMWGQMIDLRTDPAGLRRAHPELARRLDAARAGLDGDA